MSDDTSSQEEAPLDPSQQEEAPLDPSQQEEAPLDPSHDAMDAARVHLAEAYAQFERRSEGLALLLKAPERNIGEIRKAQAETRAAGIRLIGLATSYLAELNSYMKLIDKDR